MSLGETLESGAAGSRGRCMLIFREETAKQPFGVAVPFCIPTSTL